MDDIKTDDVYMIFAWESVWLLLRAVRFNGHGSPEYPIW